MEVTLLDLECDDRSQGADRRFRLGGDPSLTRVLNRSAVLLRPKQPFLDWMKQGDEQGLAAEVYADAYEDPEIYLVPEFEDAASRDRVLARCWPRLFERMLAAWSVEESTWPPNRSLQMFQQWFEIQGFALVADVGTGVACNRIPSDMTA